MSGSGLRQAFTGLAALALGLATLQFFLAGLGVFGVSGYDAHELVGRITQVVSLLVLLAAVIGGLGRSGIIFGAGLLVISVVMGLLASGGTGDNLAGAFHPLLAIFFWFGAFQAFTWGRTGEPLVDSPATAHEH